MKKILGIILALTMATSAFSLEVTAGIRAAVGGNIGNVKEEYNGIIYGGSLYANLNLFNGFGIQSGVDLVSSTISTGTNSVTFKPCEIIDVPVMLWYNNRFGNSSIGGGAGVNLSFYSDKSYRTNKNSKVNVGLALGANYKYHFSDMFSFVIGINSILDFMPTEKLSNNNGEVTLVFGTADKSRKALLGFIGIETRLF